MQRSVRPNLLVIGAARSGTTALVRALQSHPDVFVTTPKETHHFAHAGVPSAYQGPGDDLMMNASVVSDRTDFLSLFEGSTHPIRCEGSVSTMYYADRAIPAIRSSCTDDVKLIVILRAPVDRAHSSYLYLRGRGHEPIDSFDAALEAEARRIAANWHHMWHYRAMSRYEDQLPAFVKAFGEDLHLMVFEEFRSDPSAELAKLGAFLGIEGASELQVDPDTNRGGEPRSQLISRLVNGARRQPIVKRAVMSVVNAKHRDQLRARNLARPALSPSLAERLQADLRPSIDYVEDLLGRPIDAWHA